MPVWQVNEHFYRQFSASGKLFARAILSVLISQKKTYHPTCKLTSNERIYLWKFQNMFLYTDE